MIFILLTQFRTFYQIEAKSYLAKKYETWPKENYKTSFENFDIKNELPKNSPLGNHQTFHFHMSILYE